jgi:RHS repeat-associated protein
LKYVPYFTLYNYDARLYDPVMGRFISPDPYFSPNLSLNLLKKFGQEQSQLLEFITIPQNLNRYSYCTNNPLNLFDSTGLFGEASYNGIQAHNRLGGYLDFISENTGNILITNKSLYKNGYGLSYLRPDVINPDLKTVYEMKPISHLENSKYWNGDAAQLRGYVESSDKLLKPGSSSDLFPQSKNGETNIGPITDWKGNILDVVVTSGDGPLMYYKLVPNDKYKKQTLGDALKSFEDEFKKAIQPPPTLPIPIPEFFPIP